MINLNEFQFDKKIRNYNIIYFQNEIIGLI